MDSSDLLGGEDTCKFFVYCFEACLRIPSSTRFDAVSKTTMTQDAKETKKKKTWELVKIILIHSRLFSKYFNSFGANRKSFDPSILSRALYMLRSWLVPRSELVPCRQTRKFSPRLEENSSNPINTTTTLIVGLC